MNKKAVLFVGEDQAQLDFLAGSLRRKFLLLRAPNGRQAWEVLKACKIDCLVTYIDIPLMNGLDLIEKIRNADYKITTIVARRGHDLLIKKRCNELGVNGYLPRPYSADRLIEMINEGLGLLETPSNDFEHSNVWTKQSIQVGQ